MTASNKPQGKIDAKKPEEPKPWYRRISSWIIAAVAVPVLVGVLIAAIVKATGLSGGSGSTGAPSVSGGPVLGSFISPTQRIVRVYHVNLDGGSVPEVAVTTINRPTGNFGLPPTEDLLLLAWDKYARRWFVAFDAAKEAGSVDFSDPDASMWASNQFGQQSSSRVIPFTVGPKGLVVSVLRDQSGRREDLVFWSDLEVSDGEVLIVGIVHYDGQTANLAWSFSSNEPGSVSVEGSAPRQEIAVATGWETPADAHCCAVRMYRFVVARSLGSHSFPGPHYQVVSDDRPWLGAYVVAGIGGSPTASAEVAAIVPGSPAAGVLHTMDVLMGVVGSKTRTTGYGWPAIIDELASHHAGDTVQLRIRRGGKAETVTVRLASRVNSRAVNASYNYAVPDFGASFYTLTRRLARKGDLPITNGAVISRVKPGSSAVQAGLAIGDVITSFDNFPIHNSLDLEAAVAGAPAFTKVPFNFVSSSGAIQVAWVRMLAGPYGSFSVFNF